jgi:3'(2'), 5'-bisphosphate nucleotidase
MLDDPEVRFAVYAVREATTLVRRVQETRVCDALSKEDRSPVTVADLAAQAVVARRLEETFPREVLVAEEDSALLGVSTAGRHLEAIVRLVGSVVGEASPGAVCNWIDRGRAEPGRRFWTLDPVDGTKGFLRGDQYATALALVCDGQVQVAVLGCPRLPWPGVRGPGIIVGAARGRGTWAMPLDVGGEMVRLQVSDREDPARAILLRSLEASHTDTSGVAELGRRLGLEEPAVAMDSQAKYAVLAAGRGDILVRLLAPDRPDYREKIWDQAAGSLVVEEAGGRVSDLTGKALDFRCGRTLTANRGVLATNGRLHSAVLEAIAQLGIV